MLGLRGELGAVEMVGKYRIVLPLGQGGTADVYLAVADGPSGFTKLVVVKVLRKSLASDSGCPSRYSITSTGAPSTSITSLVWTTFG